MNYLLKYFLIELKKFFNDSIKIISEEIKVFITHLDS